VNYAKSYLTGAFPEIWLYALGGLFIFSTIFLPKGIIGSVASFSVKRAGGVSLTGFFHRISNHMRQNLKGA